MFVHNRGSFPTSSFLSIYEMNSEDMIRAQGTMCNEMYRLFSTLIAELTDVCVRSQMDLDEYKHSLPDLAIPNTV